MMKRNEALKLNNAATKPADGRVRVYAKQLGTFCLVFVLSGIFVKIGIAYFLTDGPAAIWPASGIGLGFLLISHRKYWGSIGIAIVAALMALDLLDGHAPWAAACFGLAAAAESFLAALLVTKFIRKRITLTTLREVIVLLFIAAFFSNAITALLGVGANALMGRTNYFEVWYRWAIADGAGMLLVTPLVVVLSGLRIRTVKFSMKALECVAVLCVFAYFCVCVFRSESSIQPVNFVLSCLLIAFLIYAGIRHRTPGAVAYNTVLFCVAIYFTLHGLGPFRGCPKHLNMSMLTLQAFLFVGGSISYLIAAAINEKDLAIQEVEEHRARQVELQERLARSEKLESLALLAGGVAHDLNNVLGPMVALPAMISEDLSDLANLNIEETQENLRMIEAAAIRAATIVRDLVQLGRRSHYDLHPMDLSQIQCLSPDCGAIKRLKEAHPDVTFIIESDNGPLAISGDESHLSRAVSNMVQNAAESIEKEGAVTIKAFKMRLDRPLADYENIPRGEYAVIEISDTGEGIDKEALDRIFEPFYTRKKKSERSGSGLGLSVVHGIVKDHAGFIDVKSDLGRGSVFAVYLPLVDPPKEDISESEVTPVVGGTERILIVDDEPGQRFIGSKSLKRLGYEVAEAEDGHQALAHFEKATEAGTESPYDLLVMDMIMEEGFDGLDTYKAILKLYPNQKVIIASGHAEEGRGRAAVDLGADWLSKPYEGNDFARAVRKRLDMD